MNSGSFKSPGLWQTRSPHADTLWWFHINTFTILLPSWAWDRVGGVITADWNNRPKCVWIQEPSAQGLALLLNDRKMTRLDALEPWSSFNRNLLASVRTRGSWRSGRGGGSIQYKNKIPIMCHLASLALSHWGTLISIKGFNICNPSLMLFIFTLTTWMAASSRAGSFHPAQIFNTSFTWH